MERPVRRRLRVSADVAAVVGVPDVVERTVGGERRVGVAVAVLDPVDRAGVGIGREAAFEVAAGAEDVAGAVDGGAVGRQAEDRGGGAGISHDGCSPPTAGALPLDESSAARPYAEVEPFTDVNEPPAMTLLPLGVSTSA